MRKERLGRRVLLFLLAFTVFVLCAGQPVQAKESTAGESKDAAGAGSAAEENGNLESVESAEAAVMRLAKTEGSVSVENAGKRKISIRDNMNLYNGYHTVTEEESYAWISLDSEKLMKLDAASEAEVRKKGEKLEMLLDSGNLFFDVSEPLEEEETLNIRTSTMVMGIRGTSGWVKVIDRWRSQVYILEGTVVCYVTDPVSGQLKSTTLTSGETAEFVVYETERNKERCDILRQGFSEREIDGFVLMELAGDSALAGKIASASGLDIGGITGEAQGRLAADEARLGEAFGDIREQLKNQENHISVDPVWTGGQSGNDANGGEEDAGTPSQPGRFFGGDSGLPGTGGNTAAGSAANSSPSSGGSSNSGGNSTSGGNSNTGTPSETANTPPPVNLTSGTDATDEGTIQNLLNDPNTGEVVVKPSADPAGPSAVNVASDITIPSGKTLTLEDGVDLNVDPGATVTVDGTLNVGGELTNNGTIIVTSSD